MRYAAAILCFIVSCQVVFAEPANSDLPKVEIVPTTGYGNDVVGMAFSPEKRRLVAVSGGKLKLWDQESGRLIRTVNVSSYSSTLTVSKDGKRAFIDNFMVNLEDGKFRKYGGDWSPDESLFDSFQCMTSSISRDEDIIAIGQYNSVSVFEVDSGNIIKKFSDENIQYLSTAISPDGAQLATAGRIVDFDTDKFVVAIWDLQTGAFKYRWYGEGYSILALRYVGDNTLAVADTKGNLDLWDAKEHKLIRRLSWLKEMRDHGLEYDTPRYAPLFISVSRDEKLLTLSIGNVVVSWGTDKFELKRLTVLDGDMFCVSVSDDGKYGLGRGPGHFPDYSLDETATSIFTLWDIDSATPVKTFGVTKAAQSVAVSPDNTSLAVGQSDGTLSIWNLRTGVLSAHIKAHEGELSLVRFTPDGVFLISAGANDGRVRIWSAGDLKPLAEKLASKLGISSVAISDDGKLLLTGGLDNTARLWTLPELDLERVYGAPISEIPSTGDGYFDHVSAVAFGNGENSLVAGYSDGTVTIWNQKTGKKRRVLTAASAEESVNFRSIKSIHFGQQGELVAAGITGSLTYWGSIKGGRKRVVPYDDRQSFRELTDRKSLLTLSGDRIELRTLPSGKLVEKVNIDLTNWSGLSDVGLAVNGRLLIASSSMGAIGIWDRMSGKLLLTMMSDAEGKWLSISPAGVFVGSNLGADAGSFLLVVRGLQTYSVGRFFEHLARPDLIEELLKGDPEGKYADTVAKLNLPTIIDSGSVPQLSLLPKLTATAGDTVKAVVRIVNTGGGIGPKVVWRVNGQSQGEQRTPTPTPEGVVIMENVLRMDPSKDNTIEVTAYNGSGLLASDPLRFQIDAFGPSLAGGPSLYVLTIGVSAYAMESYKLNFPENDANAIAQAFATSGKGLFAGDPTAVSLTGTEVNEKRIDKEFEKFSKLIKPTDVFILFLSGHGENRMGRYYYIPQDFDTELGHTWESNWLGQEKWDRWLRKIVAEKQLIILDTCEGGAALGLVKGRSGKETAMDQLRYATGKNIIAAADGTARESVQLGHGLLTYAILKSFSLQSKTTEALQPVTLFDLARAAGKEVFELRQRIWGEPAGTINKLAGTDFPIGFPINEAVKFPELTPDPEIYVALREEQARAKPDPISYVNRVVNVGTALNVLEFSNSSWVLVAKDGAIWGYIPADAVTKLK